MYKGASKNLQVRFDRQTVREAGAEPSGPSNRSDNERLDDLRAAVRAIETQLIGMPKHELRVRLVKQKVKVQDEIRRIREKTKRPSLDQGRIEALFFRAVRDTVGETEGKRLMTIAKQQYVQESVFTPREVFGEKFEEMMLVDSRIIPHSPKTI